jgi:hypothetical protein
MSDSSGAAYIEGMTAGFRAQLLDATGTPVSAENVRMIVMRPGETTSFIAPSTAQDGFVYGTVNLDRPGVWRYRFETTVPPHAVLEEQFTVHRRTVPAPAGPGGGNAVVSSNWRINELPALNPLQMTDEIAVSRGSPATTYRSTLQRVADLIAASNGLADPAGQYITPEQYGAIGDGESHLAGATLGVSTLEELQEWGGGIYNFADSLTDEMDWLAIQAAFFTGGVVRGKPGAKYKLDRSLACPNGFVEPHFTRCELSWEGMVEIPDSGVNLIGDEDLDLGIEGPVGDDALRGEGMWENSILEPSNLLVFSAGPPGKATFTDSPWQDQLIGIGSSFGAVGKQITIPVGKWTIEVKVKLTTGLSYGYFGHPYALVRFTPYGIGLGGYEWPHPLIAYTFVAFDYDGWTKIDLEILESDGPQTTWLVVQGGNGDWEISGARMSPYRMNAAVWCSGDFLWRDPLNTASPNLYDETTWYGGKFQGPTDPFGGKIGHSTGSQIDGFLHKSFGRDGPRSNFVGVHIRGFNRGVTFDNNAYLIRHEACTVGYCNTDVHFALGVQNAGENLRFTNCILFNSALAIHAENGGEWNFVNSSIDYCERLVVARKGAVMNFTNHHWEFKASPTRVYLTSVATAFATGATLTGVTSGATARILEVNDESWKGLFHLVIEVLSGEFDGGESVTASNGGAGVIDAEGVVMGEYLVDLGGESNLVMPTGEWLQAGYTHRGARYAVNLQTTMDTIVWGDVWAYNLETASGDWARGSGRVIINNLLGPGNANLPDMMIRNSHMDAFGGNGGIRGKGTWEDQGILGGPTDNIGLDFAARSAEGNAPVSRGLVPWEQLVSGVDDVFRTTDKGALKLEINSAYVPGNVDLQIFIPIAAGKTVLSEFYYSKPDVKPARTHGPFTNGDPGPTDYVRATTVEGQSRVTIQDTNCNGIGGSGPQPGWSVTLSDVTGNPGGIDNAVWNGTHTVVERLKAAGRYVIDLGAGNEATVSEADVGGAAMTVEYSQTSTILYCRGFFVAVQGYDSLRRAVITQARFTGEDHLFPTFAAQDWTRHKMATWYSPGVEMDNIEYQETEGGPYIQGTLNDRGGPGRAPVWATHWMLIIGWQNMREMDLADPPPLYLTDFYANLV